MCWEVLFAVEVQSSAAGGAAKPSEQMWFWHMARLPKLRPIGKLSGEGLARAAKIWRFWCIWFDGLSRFREIWWFCSIPVQ
jgi:hypothetical protein